MPIPWVVFGSLIWFTCLGAVGCASIILYTLFPSLLSPTDQIWPIFWTLGRGQWPNAGEIDIIEAINLQVNNQMSMHTLPGCTHASNTNEIGFALQPDCSQDSGCTVDEMKPNNLQEQFAAAGGGVWATEFDSSGIR